MTIVPELCDHTWSKIKVDKTVYLLRGRLRHVFRYKWNSIFTLEMIICVGKKSTKTL